MLASIKLGRSDFDGAEQEYKSALHRYKELEDSIGIAHCNRGLGDAHRNRKSHREAKHLYQEALEGYDESKSDARAVSAGKATCLQRLGDIEHYELDHEGQGVL